MDEPEGSLLPPEQAADGEPIWHGHGYKLDNDNFEFPPDMTSRQYFNLHVRLHAKRDWHTATAGSTGTRRKPSPKELRIPPLHQV